MTRKRFIKLMMARGFQRNEVMAWSTLVKRYDSYVMMYRCSFAIMSWPEAERAYGDLIKLAIAAMEEIKSYAKEFSRQNRFHKN